MAIEKLETGTTPEDMRARVKELIEAVNELAGGTVTVTWNDVTGKPATATAAELQAGTVTAVRMISPKLLADEIDRRIAAAAGA